MHPRHSRWIKRLQLFECVLFHWVMCNSPHRWISWTFLLHIAFCDWVHVISFALGCWDSAGKLMLLPSMLGNPTWGDRGREKKNKPHNICNWLVYMFRNPNDIALCSSRCHLLQTSSGYLLALRPRWTCPPVPCGDPQGHRGRRKRHQGIPVRTSWSNHNEGTHFVSDRLLVQI